MVHIGFSPRSVRLTFNVFLFLIMNAKCVHGMDHYVITKDLYDKLFNGSYSVDVLPVCGIDDTMNITIDAALREVIDVQEKFQTLKLKLWVRLNWTDCRLVWNPSDFNNQDQIYVPYHKIWTPDITLYEGISEFGSLPGMKDYRASIFSDGTVQYNFPSTVTTACAIDVTYFPFDLQNCKLAFGSWIYSGKHLEVFASSSSADVSTYIKNNEWHLISMTSEKIVHFYNCCQYPFSEIAFNLSIQREPKFYIITIIFPCILVTSLTFIGFFLPPSCSEKISLQITVLLSNSVFLLLIQDQLPPSSETFPVIAYFFTSSMLLVCLACIMAGIVLFVYYLRQSGREVPHICQTIFLRHLSKVFCIRYEECIAKDISVAAVYGELKERRMSSVLLKDAMRNRDSFIARKSQKIKHEDIPEEGSNASLPLTSRNNSDSNPITTGQLPNRDSYSSVFADDNVLKDKRRTTPNNLETVIHEWVHLAHVVDRLFLICYFMIYLTNGIIFIFLFSKKS